MKTARILINGTGLEFNRDYGVNRLTGWTALRGGCVLIQFVPFYRAAWTLLQSWRALKAICADELGAK